MSGRRSVVCGGNGLIGSHLIDHLVEQGDYVRLVDYKDRVRNAPHLKNLAHEVVVADLKDMVSCQRAVESMEHVYQLAADMGGAGYIYDHTDDLMQNNSKINGNVIRASVHEGIVKYFFSSSACVYQNQEAGDPELCETDELFPVSSYGQEKLLTEQMLNELSGDMEVRIARFQNTYGPGNPWNNGKEKVPAALCRKIWQAFILGEDSIEIWGDGKAVRNFIHVDDICKAITTIMWSGSNVPTNVGTHDLISINDLAYLIAEIAGIDISLEHIEGPVGTNNRRHSTARIEALGWEPTVRIREGMCQLYDWVSLQAQL